MIKRVLTWFREARRWRREHLEAWGGATSPGEDGFSRFQRDCETQLASLLAGSGMRLVERRVTSKTPDEKRSESIVFAKVEGTAIEVWIFSDGAQIGGLGVDQRFDEWDWLSPEELTTSFCTAVIELVPRHRAGGSPGA